MEKTCKSCRFYNDDDNYCNYSVYVGDTVVPNCIFVERYRRENMYYDYAVDPKLAAAMPGFTSLDREAHLKQYLGTTSAVIEKQFIIPFEGNCPTWEEKDEE